MWIHPACFSFISTPVILDTSATSNHVRNATFFSQGMASGAWYTRQCESSQSRRNQSYPMSHSPASRHALVGATVKVGETSSDCASSSTMNDAIE